MLRHNPSRPRFRRGVSLVEVTLTAMILGLLASTAIPRFQQSLDHCRTKSAAAQIQADLLLARQLAIAKSDVLAVQFDVALSEYTLEAVDHPRRVGETYTVRLNASPYAVILASADFGGDERVVFNAYGLPDGGGTITVQSGGSQHTVTIDPESGKASVP